MRQREAAVSPSLSLLDWPMNCAVPTMGFRGGTLFHNTFVRYLFAIAMVASTFALRLWLIPLTGTGAPFVLFFATVLVTSLFAGVGPGICAVLLSLPLGAYTFAMGAGYSSVQASFQSLLFAVDGIVVVYLTFLTKKATRSLQNANRQLGESEEKYRALFDSIDEGFCVVEVVFDDADNALDYRFLEVNRVFEKQTGISNSVGRRMREIAPAHEEHWFQIYGQIALTGESRRFENPALALGRFYDVYAFRLGRPEQRQVAILFNDITKRKQIEEALQESEERLELAMEAGGIRTFDWNIRTNAVVWMEPSKAAFARPSRASRGVGVYDDWAKLVRPEDLRVCEAGIQEVFRKKHNHWQAKYRMMSSDTAEERWIHSQSRIFYDAQGEPLRMIGVNIDITERKRAEETLRSVSAELRHTLHTAATGLTHCGRDLRYLSANPAYAQYIGLPLEQIVGRPIMEVMGQTAFEIIRPRVERVLSGERVEYEDKLTIGGELKYIHVVYTPDRDASGNVVGWVASVMDISERKRIEEELKAANAFLDAIIENIPLILFLKDGKSLRYLRLNRAGEGLLGWPKETFIGKTDYDLWPQAQAEFFVEKDRETLKDKMVDIAEEPIQTRHQGVRLLHTKKVPILDTAGNSVYLLGISEDITERRRIEKEQQFLTEVSVALSTSLKYEETLANVARLVVQTFADWSAVDVIDEEGQLSRLKVASADPDQAALCTVLEQMPPDRDLPHIMRAVIENKRPIVVEQVTSQYIESLVQGPGHLQALLATGIRSFVAVPLLVRGRSLGALFLGSSTLSHVFGQGDLRLAEALADRAAMAIENARLYRSSLYATQLRDQVLGVVAHDLRNPLTAILLQAGALTRRGSDPERRSQKRIEAIHRAATRMNRLIQDLLDVAVMESGRLTMEPARLSARELIVAAMEMQTPLASSSSLELRADVDRDVPDVWGDRDRLLQVFENLIGNAIKFTKAGGCITVGAASRDHEVIFRVADTGSGIAPENLPRLFDRFWQATRANRQGAGLGLPITKGIVEAHGGRIWVESTPNRGTTISFVIPQATPEHGRPSEPSGSSLLEGYRAA
jgi:PAS domain S-box-containing protein